MALKTYKGNIDELAISRGGTYETTTFTPPDGPYTHANAVPVDALVVTLPAPDFGAATTAPLLSLAITLPVPGLVGETPAYPPVLALNIGTPLPSYEVDVGAWPPVLSLVIGPVAPVYALAAAIPVLSLAMGLPVPLGAISGYIMPVLPLSIGLAIPMRGHTTSQELLDHAVRLYYFTLTGAPDGVDDVVIPISSFQARDRDGIVYLSVVIPDYDTWAASVIARPNGEMVIEGAYLVHGAEVARGEILRVNLDDIRSDRGGRSKSISLAGYQSASYGAPEYVTLNGISQRSLYDDKIRLRSLPDFFIHPNDYVLLDDTTIQVGSVGWTVTPAEEIMEVVQA